MVIREGCASAMGKVIKDTLHANGVDIGIYTQDFEID